MGIAGLSAGDALALAKAPTDAFHAGPRLARQVVDFFQLRCSAHRRPASVAATLWPHPATTATADFLPAANCV